MYFCLYKMSIDAIIMNRVLPDAVNEPYFQNWQESQKRYVQEAEAYFQPVLANCIPERFLGLFS